ncbi:MAG TPA: FAD-binding oxidoreductase [Thermomicrobiales bacterium]|jgi:hypothetical protein|nr:FAD-binding oxidoreductase [Thermomicrobiales bacterium]
MSTIDRHDTIDTFRATTMVLRERIRGTVLLPGDDGFAAAHAGFNVTVAHQPAVVVLPESAQDIVAAVRFAAVNDLRVSVQATGHGARQAREGGLLINTSRMTGVTIDPASRTARVEAGTRWGAVARAAAPHGLAPLSGSSLTVGVVGYTLGGGTGSLARRYGFAADRVTRIELVTAAGEQIVATATEYADLFRAMKGGGGAFGVVTAMEFELVSVRTVFAGMTLYPMAEAATILPAFAEWSATLPESVTSSVTLMRFPMAPVVPEPMRGLHAVAIRACHTGAHAEGERLIAPARAFGTVLVDTFGVLPWEQSDRIANDPEEPMPHLSNTMLLRDLDPQAVAALLDVAGPSADCPLIMIDIRHIDGANRHANPETAIANRHDASYLVYALGVPMGPESAAATLGGLGRLRAALAPHTVSGRFPNFVSSGDDLSEEAIRGDYPAAAWAHISATRATYDPDGRFTG